MSRCNFCCDDYIEEYRPCESRCCPPYPPRPYPPRPYPPKPYPPKPSCCCVGPRGASAYELAQYHGFTGTEAAWLESLRGAQGATGAAGMTGATGATGPFLSSHLVAFASGQSVANNASVRFDADSVIKAGNGITVNTAGTVFTITRPGLYHVEWNVNLSATTPAGVIGILENGEMLSGAASSGLGAFSSGTVINVTTVPYTLSLHNFNNAITIEHPTQWENSAASIRIVRFADGPIV